ncbi:MAG: hypothetical protein AB7U37_07050, partial [Synergistaceae bacterium]
RRHPSRQQKDAVTLAGKGCAPWPVLWWDLLLNIWLDALRAKEKNFPPLVFCERGRKFFIREQQQL